MNGQDRIPELDGLRGIAIGLVLFFHYFVVISRFRPGTPLSYLLALGRLSWSGVDLFFVLSGFLIGGILIDARQSTNYFAVFYTRRFLRIVPLYLVCLLGFFTLRAFIQAGEAQNFAYMMKDQLPAWPYFMFLQNLWMAQKDSLGAYGLGATWSLAVEEQFYLTLPLLIRLLPRHRLPAFLVSAVGGTIVLRIILVLAWPAHSLSRYVLLPCRADALLLGVLGAVAVRNQRTYQWLCSNRRLLYLCSSVFAIGLALLTYLKGGLQGTLIQTWGFSWLAAFYLSILLLAVTGPQDWVKRILRIRWLMGLGSIAYGTYLFHAFVLGALFTLFRLHTPALADAWDFLSVVAALAATLLLCKISWICFEKPLVRLGHHSRYVFGDVPLSEPVRHLRATSAGTS